MMKGQFDSAARNGSGYLHYFTDGLVTIHNSVRRFNWAANSDGKIDVFVDNKAKAVLSVTDPFPLPRGIFGLGAAGQGYADYDDAQIEILEQPGPEQPITEELSPGTLIT